MSALLEIMPGCRSVNASQEHTPPEIPVITAKAVRSDLPVLVRVPAAVVPYTTVTVKSEVSGILRRVFVREGQPVHAGEILFEIESSPYESSLDQAKAQLERDMAQMRQAAANLERDRDGARNARNQADRYSQLASEGIVSREQQEQFSTAAQIADQSVVSDQAALDVAKAALNVDRAAIGRAQVDVEHCTIRSPLDGIAGYLSLQAGNFVRADADTPLITINKVTPVFVSFALPDRYLETLRQGLARSPLSLSVLSPGAGLELASGLVRQLDNSVDLNTGTIHLRAELANEDHRLWPGEFVEAILNLRTEHQAISVPKTAIQGGEHGPYVFLVTRNATADLRLVKVGVEVGERVEILEGIQPGDDVVTDGQLRLRPAAKVRIETQSGAAKEQAQ